MASRKGTGSPPADKPPRKPAKKVHAKALPQPADDLTVVGIGASAGGLQAMQAFFDALAPDTGMAFVVVTHLHPEHESHLAELLQTHTRMPVNQVEGEVPVEANHVYVVPPNRRILMTDSHLDVKGFDEPRGHRAPVDYFFRSLARAHHNAVAIVLSGGGTDGSVGVKDIKEEGGILMIQSPEEAEYDGMPRSAISTGLADVVLPVHELARRLVEFAAQVPHLPAHIEELSEKDQDAIERALAQLHTRTGNDFSQYKRSTILRRIQRRMQINGYKDLEAYLEYLRRHPGEANLMFNDILIGVTNFFRDRPSWDTLAEKAIPALFERKGPDNAIRVWSIGCATGEEAYSLTILLMEQAERIGNHHQIQVFASDLAEASLARAREGIYPAAIEADVSPERLERFFIQQGYHYHVKRELRDAVLFTNHNLLRDPPFSHMDLIICRNLLIYLQRQVQDSVFEIFHYALNPGGFLFLGNSETAESAADLFSPADKRHRIYKSKPRRSLYAHVPSLPLSIPRQLPRESRALQAGQTSPRIERLIDPEEEHRLALESYAPPSIIVDREYGTLHVSETAGRFLLQPKGPITRDLSKLIRTELQPELRAVLFQAFQMDKASLSQPIPLKLDGCPRRVALLGRPVRQANEELQPQRALVVFLEDELEGPSEPGQGAGTPGSDSNSLIAELEAEVYRLRDQLQAAIEGYDSSSEEMKAANQELQSMNEEYRSATEELETSKEELQSLNEELQTVNNELKNKFEEASRAHSDLENLMSATEVATLFLDRELRIGRYTPGVEELLNIRPGDRGRPIRHLTHRLDYDQLVEDAEQVLRNLAILEREVKNDRDKWFLVRLRPYRTVEDRIEGVVLTFIGISALKQAEQALLDLNNSLEQRVLDRTQELNQLNLKLAKTRDLFFTLFHSNPIPTALTRLEDGVIIDANDAYLRYFDVAREEVIGHTTQELNERLGPAQGEELYARLQQDGRLRDFETTITLPSGEVHTSLVSIQHVDMEGTPAAISAFFDITDRIRAERQVRALALTSAEQEERVRISQILHDDLQQRLFAIRMHLSFLREAYESQQAQDLPADLPNLESWLSEAIQVTRRLSIDLGPRILPDEGLADAVQWLAAQMEQQFGLEVAIRGTAPLVHDETLRILLFQAVREALFNVVKHAGTLQATVTFQQAGNRLRIAVSDQGKGFDPQVLAAAPGASHGLSNVRKRLSLLGCNLETNSSPHGGTQVIIDAPSGDAESPKQS